MSKTQQYLALKNAINEKTIYSIDFENGEIVTNFKNTIQIHFCDSFKSTINAILCEESFNFYFKNLRIYFESA